MKQRGVYEKAPGSGVWWIRYVDGDGKLHREKVGRKSWAITAYQDRKSSIRKGLFQPETIRQRKVLFGEIADDAINVTPRAESGRLRIIKEWFADRDAEKIKPHEITAKLNELAAGGAALATQNRYRSAISKVYSHALKQTKKLAQNPVREVGRQRENNARVRFLEADEEKALRLALTPQQAAEVVLALHTGMRRNEQYSLRWSDVNLRLEVLTVMQSKNGERRHIPLNSAALDALGSLRALQDDTGYVIPGPPAPRSRDWRDWFEKALAGSKITNFVWHDLRHTFASRLVMAGIDLATVKELMGHRDIAMTMRYAHLAPAHKRAAVDRLVTPEKPTDTRTDTTPQTVPVALHPTMQ